MKKLGQVILTHQVQEAQDLLQLCHPKATFKCLHSIVMVFPGLTVSVLSQFSGLPNGVLGGQV